VARRFTGTGRRMTKAWLGMAQARVTVAATNTFVITFFDFVESLTILRMIGEYVIGPSSAVLPVGDAAFVAIGIGVISTDARVAGAASFPDPAEEASYPWLYLMDHGFFMDDGLNDRAVNSAVRVPYDVKSMRKVKATQSLVVIAQYRDVTGSPQLNINWARTRFLVAE